LRIGHGQLGTAKIRRIDAGFMKWWIWCFATTIIESGLDAPNANTISNNANTRIVWFAPKCVVVLTANKKSGFVILFVRHIPQWQTMRNRICAHWAILLNQGSGFNIAMKDLEIRAQEIYRWRTKWFYKRYWFRYPSENYEWSDWNKRKWI
jgi:RecG-like helicase